MRGSRFSGAIFGTPSDDDYQILRDYVLGVASPDDAEIARLGSVYGSPDVDLQDLVVLDRALYGAGPGIAAACVSALP